jgi:hypothetical protein
MTAEGVIELFLLKCASIKLAVERTTTTHPADPATIRVAHETSLAPFVKQFTADVRQNAEVMSEYYKLFYMLENDIRKLIDDTMAEAHGAGWWDTHAPKSAVEECTFNQKREQEAGVTSRSENPLDYISFGQLGQIIRDNWTQFGGILSNEKTLGRAMFSLNMLRGPIAHCGLLAEDEVERLKLTVKDWFRLLEGPK